MKKSILLIVSIGLFLLILTSCATTPTISNKGWYSEEVERLKIVQRAEELIGVKNLKKINSSYRNDCSGFVVGLYSSLGYKIRLQYPRGGRYTVSRLLYINLRQNGLIYLNHNPKKADIVFFKGTLPSSQNRISHVGIVEDILQDKTIVIIHYGSKGIARLRMNLLHPHVYKSKDGRVLNDFIVKRGSGRYLLAAEHFAGFGDLYRFCIINNRN